MAQLQEHRTGDSSLASTHHPGYLTLFITFFRIGLMTIGGGLAMITVMRHEMINRRHWIDEEEFIHSFAVATSIPGPVAVTFSLYQSYRLRGIPGAFLGVVGAVLPSFLVMLCVAGFLHKYLDHPATKSFFRGCVAAVTGQLACTAYFFIRRLVRCRRGFLLLAAGLALLVFLNLHPVVVIFSIAFAGWFILGKSGENAS